MSVKSEWMAKVIGAFPVLIQRWTLLTSKSAGGIRRLKLLMFYSAIRHKSSEAASIATAMSLVRVVLTVTGNHVVQLMDVLIIFIVLMMKRGAM